MTKNLARIAVLALGLASFTGSAVAGNGNGGTPPGQDKAAPAAQPAAATPTTPPGQAKKASTTAPSQSTAKAPGQAKQAAKASTSTPGVKPSSTTSKWTTCSTGGGTGTAATCTGNGPKADGSKQYGNGKTAAQIANSRGAPAGTVIKGPGNSQPHKVTVCGKPNNKSGGVDVHAVKSYSAADCKSSATQTQSQSTESKSDCLGTTVTSTSTATAYANKQGKVKAHGNAGRHGKHKGLAAKQQTVVSSAFTPSNANCGNAQAPALAGTAPATATAATAGTGTAAGTGAAAGTAAEAGGVLGTQVVVLKPVKKPASAGGVLGATAKLGNFATRGTLPFTGLPLWIFVLVALALIAGGLAVRSIRPRRQL